jgi:hypothetical protein
MLARLHTFLKKYEHRDEDPQVTSYQTLRKTIGWLGILLPFIMIIGAWVFWGCTTLQPSVSHYYYTNMREIFVGVLFAVALFLFCYSGPTKIDGWVSNVAGTFALGTALFPTTALCNTDPDITQGFVCYPCQQKVTSLTRIPYHATLHLICAVLFFVILGLMSVFLFRLSNYSKAEQTPQKRKRNVVFLICGLVIFISMGAAGLYMLIAEKDEQSTFVLWAEAAALLAFGISWLIKGQAYLKDKSKQKSSKQQAPA